jgi:hypothetical protein
VGLADTPRDQLGDLRTEVENQDFVVHGCGRDEKQTGKKNSAHGAASKTKRDGPRN